VANQTVSIRTRAQGELGAMPVAEVQSRLQQALNNYSNF
jgi:threonyl-tRNA synthetase